MQLHPDFPIVEGEYKITSEWSVLLPSKFNRRIEDGDLVLWQPGLTSWIVVWNNDKNETKQERLYWVKKEQSLDSKSIKTMEKNEVLYYTYRLSENAEDKRVPALYCFAFSEYSHVQTAIYFDNEKDLLKAEEICYSLSFKK